MNYLPVFLDLDNRHCLVVGGGEVALRKIRLLQQTGAQVTVLALELHPELQSLVDAKTIQHCKVSYNDQCLEKMSLVIAATDDAELNLQISIDAKARQIPVNVVDNPDLCSFTFPAIIDRSPLLIAVSTGGQAPVLARLLREKLEGLIAQGMGQLAAIAGEFRNTVKQRLNTVSKRRYFWESVFNGAIAERIMQSDPKLGPQLLQQALDDADKNLSDNKGEVYLVGAGPGNADLLTFRALRLMQQSDIVLYDRLVSAEVLNLVRRDAERVNVGKRCGKHAMTQAEINQLMIHHAQKGKRVCRLKGGDPFIFGRGGEECQALQSAGISFQVVPGVTAAAGCASYAGIPLTHRDYAQSVVFVTGHGKDQTCHLNWASLAQAHQTVVFYMGLNNVAQICTQLQAHGMSADMPVAVVEKGTTSEQIVLASTLANLPSRIKPLKLDGPSLIIVGEVVRLQSQLAWFAHSGK